MRHRRLVVTLLLALSLLTSAATAHAECAWVLWEHAWKDASWWTQLVSTGEHWTPIGAVTTRAECEKGQGDFDRQYRRLGEILATTNPAAVDRSKHTAWICLPDTVDPRGPKAK